MLKREWGAESNGKLPHLFIPGKTAALVPEFAVEDVSSAELQPTFLRLQSRTCPWAEHTDDDDDDESTKSPRDLQIFKKIPRVYRQDKTMQLKRQRNNDKKRL